MAIDAWAAETKLPMTTQHVTHSVYGYMHSISCALCREKGMYQQWNE